ncbi:MAG TPA: hypothetical protein VNR64_06420 [Vicinamibacterales bacterium]|nr:hypothetical protein [Vicinamibacterales bacterium]
MAERHPIVLAVFDRARDAAAAARALHAMGIPRGRVSVVARNHDEEGALAEQMDASPGAEVEDSRPAARLGELSGLVIAAIAVVLPGIGSIVAAGPLSAGLGEAAGHVAGGVASVLAAAGVNRERAAELQREVEQGALLLAVHVLGGSPGDDAPIRTALTSAGGRDVEVVNWRD